MIGDMLKSSRGPKANDSRFLLDVHRRELPGQDTMRRYREDEEIDLLIVGAGAGGSVLAQRLARAGWRIVILEAGPFWHPDEDWVSDEAGSHSLYWTQKRIIGGEDPIKLGTSLPQAENRVTLADEKDRCGLPIAHFSPSRCENDKASMAYSREVLKRILEAAGAPDMPTIQRYAHLIGGARMGSSPERSVVDSDQRVWDAPNVFLAAGSVCPTQGSANPALTIMALSSRLAERLAAKHLTAASVGLRAG